VFVGGYMSCLSCLWLFGYIDFQHLLCFLCCFSSSCVPYVSLDCLLVRRSVFYSMYLRHLVDIYSVQSNIMQ
jgi:hypothetical protein